MFSATAVVVGTTTGLGCLIYYSIRKHTRKQVHEDLEALLRAKVPDDSLFPLLQPYLVGMEEISNKRGYSSVLNIVQCMIGVQPTCDMALEIWPPAFECYNLTVPNMLNVPQLLLGKALTGAAPKALVSIAMYVSSRANGCAYCSAHCCSFAARRGVDPQVLKRLLQEVETGGNTSTNSNNKKSGDDERRDLVRQAVVQVAYGLGTVPASLQHQHVTELYHALPASDVEWIVAAAAMFGSFNKLMDGMGIPLEGPTHAETIGIMDPTFDVAKAGAMLPPSQPTAPSPPVDDWTLTVACLYQVFRPGGALALDTKLHGDTPATAKECMEHSLARTGSSFAPVLAPLKHVRIVRALTAILVKNFDASLSAGLGVRRKVLAGLEFCRVGLQNECLYQQLECVLAAQQPATTSSDDDSYLTELVLKVAKALCYTPNRVHPELVQEIRGEAEVLTAPMLVELVSLLAALQMLHRIETFYRVKNQTTAAEAE